MIYVKDLCFAFSTSVLRLIKNSFSDMILECNDLPNLICSADSLIIFKKLLEAKIFRDNLNIGAETS